MSKIRAAITGVHGYVPDYVLSNEELETMVDTNNEWIVSRTGIKERRILREKGLAASDMGVEMLKGLLEKTNTRPEEIDMLLCATITPDMVFPDTANTISDKIGAKNAFGYDISAACSGFLYALTTGAKFIETGTYKKVVIVGLDVMSSIIDYSDRATCVIFGDGGGAVMLEPTTDGTGIQDSILRSNGHGRHFLHMKAGGSLKPTTQDTVAAREHFVYQEGRTVFKHAVHGMSSAVADLFERNQLEEKDIDWLVPHQANKRIIDVVAGKLNFPMEKVMVNIHKYGNTTAGTLPLCLWDWEDKLNTGDKIVLTAFGGGFTWGATYLIWS